MVYTCNLSDLGGGGRRTASDLKNLETPSQNKKLKMAGDVAPW